MLYKFKSKASADLIMLEPNGRRILQIIGKDTAAKGILLPEQMPAAVAALQAAVALEEAQQQALHTQTQAADRAAPKIDAPGLRQRTLPLIDMLQRCARAAEPITWGV